MALNPDDFIFHSDLLYEQRVERRTVSVYADGTIGAGASRSWASSWYTGKYGTAKVRSKVYVPGTTYNMLNISNATISLPATIQYNSGGMVAVLRVQIRNGQYRCMVQVTNPYSSTQSAPNKTFKFDISIYLPQKQ